MKKQNSNGCTYEVLIQTAERMISILSENSFASGRYSEDIKWLQQQLHQWKNQKIRVGVVGVTSSGKSTLINALLGEAILSTAVRPSSSQLVSCSKGVRKATIYFENGKKKELTRNITMEEIRKYSDEKYNPDNQQAVAQLEFSTPTFALGDNVLLIDSPGLDAYGLEKHEKLTLETLIPTVDVCMYITTVKTNSDKKTAEFLGIIKKNQCPVIIVQNMIDSIKPSPDGRKTEQQVAVEHKGRMKRIIDTIDLETSQVSICQISAQMALDAITGIRKPHDLNAFLMKWGYSNLIDTVKRLIDTRMPEINYQRLTALQSCAEHIIEMDKPLYSDSAVLKKFEFEGLNDEIEQEYEDTCSKLEQLFNVISEIRFGKKTNKKAATNLTDDAGMPSFMKRMTGFINYSSSTSRDFSSEYSAKEYFRECKAKIGEIETEIGQTIIGFNDYIRKVIYKLGLPERDMLSYNGMPSVPNLEVKSKSESYTVREKQPGVGGFLKRIVSFGNWGYDEKTSYRDVYDEDATKKAFETYIKRVIEGYSHTIESWQKNANATIENILNEIESARRRYDNKLPKNHLGQPYTKTQIESLRKISKDLQTLFSKVKYHKVNVQAESVTNSDKILSQVESVSISKNTAAYIQLESLYRQSIHQSCIRAMHKYYNVSGQNTLIVGWDYLSCSQFLYNFFGVVLNNSEMNGVVYCTKEVLCLNNEQNLYNYSEKSRFSAKTLYILVNATQFGAAEKQLHESNVLSLTSPNDLVVFVIQDFQETINGKHGQGISETIQLMLELKSRMGIRNASVCAINHENPLYNLAFLQRQITPPKHQQDEILIVNEIAKEFPWVTIESKKIIGDILRIERKV